MDHREKRRPYEYKTDWLGKRGNAVTGWKRRFFVLTFEHLEWYLDEERTNKRGVISITALKGRCRRVRRSSNTFKLLTCSPNGDDEERAFYFKTTHPRRRWDFLADDRQSCRDWIRAINLMYSDSGYSGDRSKYSESKTSSRDADDCKLTFKSTTTDPTPYELNDYEQEMSIETDDEFSDEIDSPWSSNDALTELRIAIDLQHGGSAHKWIIHALAEKVAPETLFREFYRGQERPNWNSRFGGYWEEILSTLVTAKIDPDCIAEDRTFFHVLAKDHHQLLYDALYSLGPSLNKRDVKGLTVLDYFIRTSSAFIERGRWWETFQALVNYGFQSSSLERSFRQLRYQIDSKKLATVYVLALVEKAEGFRKKWERDLQKLLLEIPSGFPISGKVGVNQLILQFCYGDILDTL